MAGLEPGVHIDRFVLRAPLGQGGMAMTYLADDPESHGAVVLKIPDPNQLGDAATFERFRRELAIGRKLRHPAISRLIAAREDGQYPYLALEYIEGDQLARVLDSGPPAVDVVADYARQLADLLAYCHSQGVIHRDLKPSNIIVGQDGRLHVIDFGIASVQGMPRVTWRGFSSLAGTAEYMAPEKIRGERGTPRVDIYAFGITLYEMLTGQVPYRAEHPLSTMYLHLESTPEPVLTLRPETPPYLAAIAARCMRRRPAERYADGHELLADLLEPEQVDLSVLDRPDPPMGSSSVRNVEDNPIKFVIWAAVGGLLLGFGLLALLYRHR
ncbi:MAG TPA: serine/threonine-protein kinase [Symbiobacteriaceae bacterium]|jgi:serine/threonine-protein kinase